MQAQYSGTGINYGSKRRFIFSNVDFPDKIVDLRAGQGWAVKGRRRQQAILCLKGRLWVTQENDIQDYVLEEGDAFLITRPGLVMVRALVSATVGYCEGRNTPSTKGRRRTVFN